MKLYVLVRKDLSTSYRAVQAGHAVAEFLLNGPRNHSWSNGILIYLGVENEAQLKCWVDRLSLKGIPISQFREPDIDNQLTAIATVAEDKHFKSLQLL